MKPRSSSLLLPFETLINRCIGQDLTLAEGVARHAGKTLLLDITSPPIQISAHFYPGHVVLSLDPPKPANPVDSDDSDSLINATIQGSSLAFLKLVPTGSSRPPLVNPDIRISGDSEFVQDVYTLFSDLQVDWQEPFSRIFGDIPTHGLEQLVDGFRSLARSTADNIRRNLDEYLHEESRMTPPRNQVKSFDQDLDALRLRLDRLQAHLDILASRLENPSD